MFPWTCDATLPTAQRYASLKFRRMSRAFEPSRLGWAEACELVAFHETIGSRAARFVFHWDRVGVAAAKRLIWHVGVDRPEVLAMIDENHAALERADGLGVLKAMQDGGWRQGGVPDCVRMALLDMRDAGLSMVKIADMTGVGYEALRNITTGPRWRRPAAVSLKDAALFAN